MSSFLSDGTDPEEESLEELAVDIMKGSGFLSQVKGQMAKFMFDISKFDNRFVNVERANDQVLKYIYEYLKWVGMDSTAAVLVSESPVVFDPTDNVQRQDFRPKLDTLLNPENSEEPEDTENLENVENSKSNETYKTFDKFDNLGNYQNLQNSQNFQNESNITKKPPPVQLKSFDDLLLAPALGQSTTFTCGDDNLDVDKTSFKNPQAHPHPQKSFTDLFTSDLGDKTPTFIPFSQKNSNSLSKNQKEIDEDFLTSTPIQSQNQDIPPQMTPTRPEQDLTLTADATYTVVQIESPETSFDKTPKTPRDKSLSNSDANSTNSTPTNKSGKRNARKSTTSTGDSGSGVKVKSVSNSNGHGDEKPNADKEKSDPTEDISLATSDNLSLSLEDEDTRDISLDSEARGMSSCEHAVSIK